MCGAHLDARGRRTEREPNGNGSAGAAPLATARSRLLTRSPSVARHHDLVLEVRGNAIRISGKVIDYGGKASVHRRERIAGSFDRTITLPVQLDPDRVTAEYRDGLLALSLPRTESDKP